MRSLNPSEKRLLLLFGLAIFVVVNLVVVTFFTRAARDQKRELTELRAKKIEAEAWIGEVPLWKQRKAWLDEKQPAYPGATASSLLLQKVQENARNLGLTIIDQSLPEPVTSPNYREVSVRLKAQCNPEQLARWLASMQQPELFQAVTALKVVSDKEPPKLIAEIQIARWYAP